MGILTFERLLKTAIWFIGTYIPVCRNRYKKWSSDNGFDMRMTALSPGMCSLFWRIVNRILRSKSNQDKIEKMSKDECENSFLISLIFMADRLGYKDCMLAYILFEQEPTIKEIL